MNGPTHIENGAEPGDDPDELERAYQHASERDTVRPGPQVRGAILAHARRAVAKPGHADRVALPAANDARWHWRAAAGLAAVGLVGVLSWHFVRVAPPRPAPASMPAPAAAVAVIAPPVPLVASTAKQLPIPELQRASPAPPAAAQVEAEAEAAAPAAARASAPLAAFSARAAIRAADVAVSGAAPGWPDRVLQTVRQLYPELFAGESSAEAHPPIAVTIALNPDGSVYASRRGTGSVRMPEQRDAAARVAQAFDIATDSLAPSGVIAPRDGPVIVYGIRAAPRTDAAGSP